MYAYEPSNIRSDAIRAQKLAERAQGVRELDSEVKEALAKRLLLFTTYQAMPPEQAVAAYFGKHKYSDLEKLILEIKCAIGEIGWCEPDFVSIVPTEKVAGLDLEALAKAAPSLGAWKAALLPSSGRDVALYKAELEKRGAVVHVVEGLPTSPVSKAVLQEHLRLARYDVLVVPKCFRSTGVWYAELDHVVKAAEELGTQVVIDESYTFGLESPPKSSRALRYCFSNAAVGGLPGALLVCHPEAVSGSRALALLWRAAAGSGALDYLASLKESLAYILAVGVANWRKTVSFKAQVVHKRLSKAGYKLVVSSEEYRCPPLVVARAPPHVNVAELVGELKKSGMVVDRPGPEKSVLRVGVMGSTTVSQAIMLSELLASLSSPKARP